MFNIKSLGRVALNTVVISASFCFSAAQAANLTITKLPTQYTTADGTTFNHMEGHVITGERNKITMTVPAFNLLNVRRDSVMNVSIHQQTCSKLYGLDGDYASHSPSRYTDLVPMKPVADYVHRYKFRNPSKTVIGINLGFFEAGDEDNFPNRPSNWKALYQEACGLNLGSYRSNEDNLLYSMYSDKEQLPGGGLDEPFGTYTQSSAGTWSISKRRDIDHHYDPGDFGFPGTYLRYGGNDTPETKWPNLVTKNKDKVVARTAYAFNNGDKTFKFLVVQGGRRGGNDGMTLAHIKSFFPSTEFGYVMLLDGSGSSQMASSIMPTGNSTPNRTDCNGKYRVAACSMRGDNVEGQYVSHWDSDTKEATHFENGKQYYDVDRRTPNVLIMMD
jgi:hypothetical protein